jgi:hypothetical protein
MKRCEAIVFSLLFICATCIVAQGQTAPKLVKPPAACVGPLDDVRKDARGSADRQKDIASLLSINEQAACFAQFAAQRASQQDARSSYTAFLKALENARTDKQAGSSTGTGGTSSLVSKGTTAQVLSVAAEYGALTESVSNQVVTVKGSLEGLPVALIRQGILPYCPGNGGPQDSLCAHEGLLRQLRKISYGVSFNTTQNPQSVSGTPAGSSQGNTQPVTFTATGHQITAATARFILWNARDSTSAEFKKKWEDALKPSSTAKAAGVGTATSTSPDTSPSFLEAAGTSLKTGLQTLVNSLKLIPENKDYTDWFDRAEQALLSASDTDLEQTWSDQMDQFLVLAQKADPNYLSHVNDFLRGLSRYSFEENDFINSLAYKPVLTLEYDNNRPAGQIYTSKILFAFDKGFGGNAAGSIVANGAFEIYDSQPSKSIPGASRWRDAQFGAEVDWKLASTIKKTGLASIIPNATSPTVSATYYFQHQISPAILNVNPATPLQGITLTRLSSNATQVFARKGNISIGQLKLTLGSGSMRVPFAVSYSNRTELITKHEWKAEIGISYDFDSLFASAGSGKTGQ